MRDADEVIFDFVNNQAKWLETEILRNGELLDLFMKMDDNDIVRDQIAIITTQLDELITKLLKIRQDSEFMEPHVQGVIDKMGNIKPIPKENLIESLKLRHA